jgi:hypothetical protein
MIPRISFVLVLLAACAPGDSFQEVDWDNVDTSWSALPQTGQSPPPNPTLTIEAGPMVQGWPSQILVHGAPPGASVYIARSLAGLAAPGAGQCFAQLGGQCIDLAVPAQKLCEVQADPAGNAGCAISVVPVAASFAGQEICVQAVVPSGATSQIGGTDCVTIQRLRTPLTVGPDPLEVTVNQGRTTTAVVNVGNVVPAEVDYAVSSDCASFVTLDTGASNPLAGTAPAGGNGQFHVEIDATSAPIGAHDCTLTVTPTRAAVPASTIDFELEVVAPGVTVVVPPSTTTPTNLGGTVTATVTGPTGAPLAGYPTTFTIIADTCDGTFLQNGGTQFTTVTAANGTAFATVTPTSNCTGAVGVTTTVTDPSTGTVISTTSTTLTWTATPGQIYFWTIAGGAATIQKMPASYTLPAAPPVNALPGYAGQCVGCHAAPPRPLPTTGASDLFFSLFSANLRVLGDAPGIATQSHTYGDASAHNQFNFDATKVVFNNEQDIWTYDVLADTWQAVPGANSDTVRELFPTFSSDGSHIAYASVADADPASGLRFQFDVGGNSSIRTIPVGGGTPVELVPAEPGVAIYYPAFSPDGRWLAFNKSTSNQYGVATPSSYSSQSAELWIVPVDAAGSRTTGPARRLTELNYLGGTYGAASWASWAPDGGWLAFARLTNAGTGNWDIFLAAVDAEGHVSPPVAMPQASTTGVGEHLPVWGP